MERDISKANINEPKLTKHEIVKKLGVAKPSLPYRVMEKIDMEMTKGIVDRKDHMYEGPEFPGGVDPKDK